MSRNALRVFSGVLAFSTLTGFPTCVSAQQKSAAAAKKQSGTAVFYNDKFHGEPLTSGEKYDKDALTAADRTIPMGSTGEGNEPKNQKSVVVESTRSTIAVRTARRRRS